MELEALIVSQDETLVRMLSLLLGDLAVRVDHCTEIGIASDKIMRRKFDAVFADFTLEGADRVLASVRRSPSNKRSLAFALIGQSMTVSSVFELGANFLMYTPLTVER